MELRAVHVTKTAGEKLGIVLCDDKDFGPVVEGIDMAKFCAVAAWSGTDELRAGDAIVAVDGELAATAEQVSGAIRSASSVKLEVRSTTAAKRRRLARVLISGFACLLSGVIVATTGHLTNMDRAPHQPPLVVYVAFRI